MRRDVAGSLVLLAVVALLVLRPWEGDPDAGPRAATAEVVRVVDGDTFEARVEGEVEDVRLIGVDTPESVAPDKPVQCFGPRASRFAERLLEDRRVRLLLGAERRDRYDRLLAYAYLAPSGAAGGEPRGPSGDGSRAAAPEPLLVNAVLLRRGLARTLTIPPNDRLAPRFRRLELRAARAGRGLWGACGP